MKVVYLVSLFPCWSETFIVREIRALIEQGVDVRIVSLKHPSETLVQDDAKALLERVVYPLPALTGALAALAEIVRSPVRALRDLARIVTGLRGDPVRIAKSIATWWRALALLPRVRSMQAQRLHAHWATYPATAAQAMAARIGLPFGFTCHAHDIFVEWHFVGSKIAESDLSVTISRFNVDWLAQRCGPGARERLHVVHCGVVPAEIRFLDAERDEHLVLSVGRLDAIKGFETLIDALAILAGRGRRLRCDIVGEGPLRAPLQARIDAAGLADTVQLIGALPATQVRERLDRAGVFALASRVTPEGDRDGIPVALMEAMAAGAPVVSTTVSGIPELIEHGVHGLLVPPDDARALADAIAAQCDDPHNARAMARTARSRIEQEFDVAKEAAHLRALFERASSSAVASRVLAHG